MAAEGALQKKIIKWLKENGAYVIKTKPQPGTPVGCPDVIALYLDQWAALEVKKAANAKDQPGQKATQAFLRKNNYFVYRVHPDNWPEIKQELADKFFLA